MIDGQLYLKDGSVMQYSDTFKSAVGGFGFEVIGDTAEHTPPAGQCYTALHCASNTVFADFDTTTDAPIEGTFVGTTHSAGFWIFGKFTSITLTSGDVYAYKGVL